MANLSSHLVDFPDFCILTPQKSQMSTWGLEGQHFLPTKLYYVDSQINLQTCTTFGANRSIRFVVSPDFCIFDPLQHVLVRKKPGGTKWKKWQHVFLCSQYYLGYFKFILQDYSKKYDNISFPYINRYGL